MSGIRGELDIRSAADLLDGRPDRDIDGFGDRLAASGLVAVYGMSDDLIELRGAIRDEADAYQGVVGYRDDGRIHFEAGRLAGGIGIHLTDEERAEAERLDEIDHRHEMPAGAPTVDATFGDVDGFAWTFATDIAHATFVTTLHGEPFCRGIVMRLEDMLPRDGA